MKNKIDILKDSCNYLYQYGFNGTSVDNLAENANITKKTLYRYFNSKERLIEDSLEFRHEWFMTQLSQFLDNSVGETVIDGYLQFLKNWLISDDFYGCMFINVCGEFSEQNHPLHQKALTHKKQVIELLEHKILNTNLEKSNAKTIAELLFIYGEGLIVAKQVGVINRENIDAYIANLQNLLSVK